MHGRTSKIPNSNIKTAKQPAKRKTEKKQKKTTMTDGALLGPADPSEPRLWLRDELFEHGVVHPAPGDSKRVTTGALHAVIFELLQTVPAAPWAAPRGSPAVAIECVG